MMKQKQLDVAKHADKLPSEKLNLNSPYVFTLSNSTTAACTEPSFHARKTTHGWPKECLK